MEVSVLKEKAAEIEDIIYGFLPEGGRFDARITEAVNYSVKAGGKRLRPMLMAESYKMFADGENPEAECLLKAFMAGIECIHTYSLVHDDLPAMDNDMLRRGKPTTHAIYGEAFGVLAGDALLNYAFEIAACGLQKVKDAEILARGVKALAILSEKAGIHGMVGGQCLDVYSEKTGLENDLEQIMYIYENKTAALLEASLMVGAVLAGAPSEYVDKLEKIGSLTGFAFQIRDDILDICSTTEQLGKPVGSDEKNSKATYAVLKGLNEAQKDVESFSVQAAGLLDEIPFENMFLKDLILFLTERDK